MDRCLHAVVRHAGLASQKRFAKAGTQAWNGLQYQVQRILRAISCVGFCLNQSTKLVIIDEIINFFSIRFAE
jgi:hypothetical protein